MRLRALKMQIPYCARINYSRRRAKFMERVLRWVLWRNALPLKQRVRGLKFILRVHQSVNLHRSRGSYFSRSQCACFFLFAVRPCWLAADAPYSLSAVLELLLREVQVERRLNDIESWDTALRLNCRFHHKRNELWFVYVHSLPLTLTAGLLVIESRYVMWLGFCLRFRQM